MKNIILLLCSFLALKSSAQSNCNWQTLNQDGFEYTTAIPDLQPGVAVHSNPMPTGFASGYVAYAGTYAMYLNFIDFNGGLGTAAGAKVYERTYTVCPGMPVRIRAWMTTMFSGAGYLQCDVKLVIRDANGIMLDSVPSLSIPFRTTGGWIEYISGSVVATTPSILFQMYTNVAGGQGNDLTMDELRLQGCIRTGSQQAFPICSNGNAYDLYNALPSNSVNNGSWNGPSPLSGGHLGTFTVGSNATGTYTYFSTPYSSNAGCPTRTDTVLALSSTAPTVNLPNDTTLCLNQSLPLNAGGGANAYLWSTGSTFSGITASNPGTTPATVTYSVTVTNQSGCSARDSVTIDFISCSGFGESSSEMTFRMFPNPAHERVEVSVDEQWTGTIELHVVDATGKTVLRKDLHQGINSIQLNFLDAGHYQALLLVNGKPKGRQSLVVR